MAEPYHVVGEALTRGAAQEEAQYRRGNGSGTDQFVPCPISRPDPTVITRVVRFSSLLTSIYDTAAGFPVLLTSLYDPQNQRRILAFPVSGAGTKRRPTPRQPLRRPTGNTRQQTTHPNTKYQNTTQSMHSECQRQHARHRNRDAHHRSPRLSPDGPFAHPAP